MKEWEGYFTIYPFAEYRADYRNGLIASAIYNVNRAKASDKAFNPADFIPDFLNLEDTKPKLKDKPNEDEFQHKLRVFKALVS